jgi:DNA-binding CsgD family transcriptional regulator
VGQVATGYANAEHAAAALSTRGRLQLAEGDAAGAAQTLRAAVERWRELNVPYEVATAQTLLGQALRETGDEDGATESFSGAAKLFDQLGARLDMQLLTGESTPSRPAGLTEREIEVLQLVAAGKTNNEIAADLYLSAKTVSRHLSNIFTKIGVTSRAAATAFAFEHGLVQTRT